MIRNEATESLHLVKPFPDRHHLEIPKEDEEKMNPHQRKAEIQRQVEMLFGKIDNKEKDETLREDGKKEMRGNAMHKSVRFDTGDEKKACQARIKELVDADNKTYAQISVELGKDPTYISGIVSSGKSITVRMLKKIADRYGVSEGYLITGDGYGKMEKVDFNYEMNKKRINPSSIAVRNNIKYLLDKKKIEYSAGCVAAGFGKDWMRTTWITGIDEVVKWAKYLEVSFEDLVFYDMSYEDKVTSKQNEIMEHIRKIEELKEELKKL